MVELGDMGLSALLVGGQLAGLLFIVLVLLTLVGVILFLHSKGFFAKYPFKVEMWKQYGDPANPQFSKAYDRARYVKTENGKMLFQFQKHKNFTPTIDQSYITLGEKNEQIIQLIYVNHNEYGPIVFESGKLVPRISGSIVNTVVDMQTDTVLHFTKQNQLDRWWPLIAVVVVTFAIGLLGAMIGGYVVQAIQAGVAISQTNAQVLARMDSCLALVNNTISVSGVPPM